MYSKGFREAALRLYEYCGNMKTVAIALQIGVATVWRWIRNGITPKKRIDNPRCKFTEAILAFINARFEQNNHLTLKDIKKDIFISFHINLSRQCIANAIKKLGLSRKRMHRRGYCRKYRLIERHYQFIQEYKKLKTKGINVIATDEVGFDQYVLPIYGYSPLGTKAFCKSHPRRRDRLSIIMSIDPSENHYFEFVKGTTTSERYKKYIEQLKWPKGTTLLMDNASIHRSPMIKNALLKKGYTSIYIPPYSPDCNPIENVFSVIKHKYRNYSMDHSKRPESILKTIIDIELDRTMYVRCYRSMEKYIEEFESKYLQNYGIARFCMVRDPSLEITT